MEGERVLPFTPPLHKELATSMTWQREEEVIKLPLSML